LPICVCGLLTPPATAEGVPGAVSVGVAGSIAFLFFSPLGPATGDGAAGAAGVTPLGADLFAVIYGIKVSWTAVLSSPALAEVNVNSNPPAGMSSRKVTFSDTLADVALDANIAVILAGVRGPGS